MIKLKLLLSSLLVLFCLIPSLYVQKSLVRGVVRDSETREVLSYVTVVSTNKSVQTDNQGRFEVEGDLGSPVRFSFVGYETLQLPLSDRLKEVLLTRQESELDEVVVIGYGQVARRDLTGSVGTVSMENLEKAPVSSFEEGLAGRVAGVAVSATDGQPGQGMNIIIRGANSLTQSNAPLYVIDGFPIEDPDNGAIDRKSTRLNSSHVKISYAV